MIPRQPNAPNIRSQRQRIPYKAWAWGLWAGLVAGLPLLAHSQAVYYGSQQWVEYRPGQLPLVLSVPHGGALRPTQLPDRSCPEAIHSTDANTLEVAQEIAAALEQRTGCRPYLVLAHLHRSKLDYNRPADEATCGHPEALTSYQEYHQFITQAQDEAELAFGPNFFFVDLHGHGNPIDRIELGYLLYDDELALSDATLNSDKYLAYSSIQNLVRHNTRGYTHAQLLRGPKALGTLFEKRGYPSVPSEQQRAPGPNTNYYSGGYITAQHTCYQAHRTANGVQMELYYPQLRDTETNRKRFATAFADVLLEYLDTHFAPAWGSCTVLGQSPKPNTLNRQRLPHPAAAGKVRVPDLPDGLWHFSLSNTLGQTLVQGTGQASEGFALSPNLHPATYILRCWQANDAPRSYLLWVY